MTDLSPTEPTPSQKWDSIVDRYNRKAKKGDWTYTDPQTHICIRIPQNDYELSALLHHLVENHGYSYTFLTTLVQWTLDFAVKVYKVHSEFHETMYNNTIQYISSWKYKLQARDLAWNYTRGLHKRMRDVHHIPKETLHIFPRDFLVWWNAALNANRGC